MYFIHTSADGALEWNQEPQKPTRVEEKQNATLKWDYESSGAIDSVQWIHQNLVIGRKRPPASPVVAPAFPRFRISEEENATFYITNVSRSDAGEYICRVEDKSFNQIASKVELVVLCKYTFSVHAYIKLCEYMRYCIFRHTCTCTCHVTRSRTVSSHICWAGNHKGKSTHRLQAALKRQIHVVKPP